MKKIITGCLLMAASAVIAQQSAKDKLFTLIKKQQVSLASIASRSSAGSTLCAMDSLRGNSWHESSSTWTIGSKTEYKRNTHLDITQEKMYSRNSNGYILNYINSYTYSPKFEMLQRISENVYNGTVAKSGLEINQYDGNSNLLANTYYAWQSQNSQWRVNYASTYTYNAANQIVSFKTENWNYTLNMLQNTNKFDYTYNSLNLETSGTTQEWRNSSWRNQLSYNISYDIFNNMTLFETKKWDTVSNVWADDRKFTVSMTNQRFNNYTGQVWDKGSSSWVNESKYVATYNSNMDLLTEENSRWIGAMWTPESKASYTYDLNGRVLKEQYQQWSTTGTSSYFYTNTYDSKGNKIQSIYETFTNNVSVIKQKQEYFYDCLTAGANDEKINTPIIVFPNPSSDVLQIKGAIDQLFITIFDTSGKLVISGNAAETIAVKGLDKGIYLIIVTDNTGAALQTTRFVKD
jgi:hypothetical protein